MAIVPEVGPSILRRFSRLEKTLGFEEFVNDFFEFWRKNFFLKLFFNKNFLLAFSVLKLLAVINFFFPPGVLSARARARARTGPLVNVGGPSAPFR